MGILGKKAKFAVLASALIFISGCATAPRQISQVGMGLPGVYHVVEKGQTLWRISKTYNLDVYELMRVNRISDPSQIRAGQKLFIPGATAPLPVEPFKSEKISAAVEELVGPKRYFSRWRSITLHHSATLEGCAQTFDKNHRKRRMGGLFYHFVIGNGTNSGDGEIEIGWRWHKQAQVNRLFDIQICLVGNFNEQEVSQDQFESLVDLVAILCKQYNIPVTSIRRHKDIPGRATECPGSHFPFYKLLAEVKKRVY
jgi:LysM repeat protein